MNPGTMDRRITLKTPATAQDSTGFPAETFSVLASNVPAQLIDIDGNEINRDGEQVAAATTIFRIRHRKGVSAKVRVVYDSDEYDTLFVKRLGRKSLLELQTRRRAD